MNDEETQIADFLNKVKQLEILAEIQFIPWNPDPQLPYSRPSKVKFDALLAQARSIHPIIVLKPSSGIDVLAGCGQLVPMLRNAATTEKEN